jgi:integrase
VSVIFSRCLKELAQFQQARSQSRKITSIDGMPTGPVFAYPDGSYRRGTWWKDRLDAALEKAAIQRDKGADSLRLGGHSFRHTLASDLRARGVSNDIIKAVAGWSSAQMQENYTHADPELIDYFYEALNKRSRIIAPS